MGYVKYSRKNDIKNEYNKIFKIEKEYKWEKIKLPLIKLLKDLGYKSKNEFAFVKKDKKNFIKLLYSERIIKSLNNQEKNKNTIDYFNGKLNLFDKFLLELFDELFYKFKKDGEFLKDFKNFYEKIKLIDDNFYKEKKYRLIPRKKEDKSFKNYIEDYCGLSSIQKEKVKDLKIFFKGKDITIKEIEDYRKMTIRKVK